MFRTNKKFIQKKMKLTFKIPFLPQHIKACTIIFAFVKSPMGDNTHNSVFLMLK